MSKNARKQNKHQLGRCPKWKACNRKKNYNSSFDDEKKAIVAETDLRSCYNQ